MPISRPRASHVHPPGWFQRLADRIRGREQLLVRAGDDMPLLLISYPKGSPEAAAAVETGYAHTLRALAPQLRARYQEVLLSLPPLVVVVLRTRNACGCLGHHHPRGAESRLTRRLAEDLGSQVGEIDLAYEGIREWRPQPLSSMALGELGGRGEALHCLAATLAVLLHELEHLAYPDRSEREIRARSNDFYAAAMEDLVSGETNLDFGMAAPPRS